MEWWQIFILVVIGVPTLIFIIAFIIVFSDKDFRKDVLKKRPTTKQLIKYIIVGISLGLLITGDWDEALVVIGLLIALLLLTNGINWISSGINNLFRNKD